MRSSVTPDHRSTGASGSAARIILIALALIGIDQATKWWITRWLGPSAAEHRKDLAGRFLAFEYAENTGAAFGLLAGRPWLVTGLAMLVAVGFAVLLLRELAGSPVVGAVVGLVLGGAAGNLIDRIRLGYVVDFIAVGPWPNFNVADAAITGGALLVAIALVRGDASTGDRRDRRS
jgi:signal peptidase II